MSCAVRRALHIAWTGAGPREGSGGAPGVAMELLDGLAALGHRIDCFLPGTDRQIPARLDSHPNLRFVWGNSDWRWNRWYSRTRLTAIATGLVARSVGSLRLRRELRRGHARDPYDLFFQFSNIESLAVPRTVVRRAPFVIFPSAHMAGELRWLFA